VALVQDLGLAAEDHVEAVAPVTLPEDDLARLEPSLADSAPRLVAQLDEVGREQEVHEPRRADPELAVRAGQLRPVERAPGEPARQPGDPEAQRQLRHGPTVPERAELPQALEVVDRRTT